MKTALIQMKASMQRDENLNHAGVMIEQAVKKGAQVICLQECFATWFFPQRIEPESQVLAEPLDGPTVTRMRALAKSHGIVLIIPIYERRMAGELYNAAVISGTDGEILGVYRKHHIPMSARFNEKFYFRPGNKGFPVFQTEFGNIGIMICYDRHFPESARMLGLAGAEYVFVPTAACSPYARTAWEIELRGHAVANGFFVGGVNRVGREFDNDYFGSSLFIDPLGQIICQAGESKEEVLVADLSRERLEEVRKTWPFYRDRRPEAYKEIVAP